MQIDPSKLLGQHVYLETLQAEHMGVLKSLAKDESLWEYTKTLLLNEKFDEQYSMYMQAAFDERATGGQHSFVIRQTCDDAVIGMTRYYKIEPAHKRLSIGFTWYVPQVWGKVHNKECKLLLLQYAFEELKYQRVEFEVAHQNIRSQKAVQKIGGVPEGRLRKHGLHADGTVRDTIVFSIIDDEWPEKKAALLGIIENLKMENGE
jgi:RimJ/RimL family protein N-acetyltransferase